MMKYIETTAEELALRIIIATKSYKEVDWNFYTDYTEKDIAEVNKSQDTERFTEAYGVTFVSIFEEENLLAIGCWGGGNTAVCNLECGYEEDALILFLTEYFEDIECNGKVLLEI